MKQKSTLVKILQIAGILLLMYAYLGNYTALPGYLRFLERGRTSSSGNTFDTNVLIGAVKTITWLFAFQLGIILTLLSIFFKNHLNRRALIGIIIGAVDWLIVAGIPHIPGPYRLFYAIGGGLVLLLIVFTIYFWARHRRTLNVREITGADLQIIGYAFFAFAAWDVCGLGTMGRMLHPEQVVQSDTGPLLITQMTKIMFEFLFAWAFTCLGHYKTAKAR